MQPTSLAVTPTAPGADAPDAPVAPALTLAADTRSVRQIRKSTTGGLRLPGAFDSLVTTSSTLQGWKITRYMGVVSSHVVAGTGLFSDIAASFTDVFGGRSQTYQRQLEEIQSEAVTELASQARRMGANAIVGLSVDHDQVSGGGKSQMFMVTAMGTAVLVERDGSNDEQAVQGRLSADGRLVESEMNLLALTRKLGRSNPLLSASEWERAVAGRFEALAPLVGKLLELLADTLLESYGDSPSSRWMVQTKGARSYFLSIDSDRATEVLYPLAGSDRRDLRTFAESVLREGRLVDYATIADMYPEADGEARETLLKLLLLGRDWYSAKDLDGLRAAKLVVRKHMDTPAERVERKAKLAASARLVWKCVCGHFNPDRDHVCSRCQCSEFGLRDSAPELSEALERLEDYESVIAGLLEST